MPVDVTFIFQFIFNTFNNIYVFLNNIRFSAFGFNFTLIGIFISFIILVLLINILKFGFVNDTASNITFSRAENRKNKDYEPRHREKDYSYVPLHGELRSSKNK